jgi:hypothetical protein
MKANNKILSSSDSSIEDKGFVLVDSLVILGILIIMVAALVFTASSFTLPAKSQGISMIPHNSEELAPLP